MTRATLSLSGKITAGDSLSFTAACSLYPATDGWILTAVLSRQGVAVTAKGTAVGSAYSVAFPAAETAKLTAGEWSLSLLFAKAGERKTIAAGEWEVMPDPAKPSKSRARRIADNLAALMEGRSLPYEDVDASNINGQQVTRIPAANLLTIWQFWESKAKREESRANGSRGGHIQQFIN